VPPTPPAAPPASPWSATGATAGHSAAAGYGTHQTGAWTQPQPVIAGGHPWSPTNTDSAPRPVPAWRRTAIGGLAAVVIGLGAGGVGGFIGYALHDDANSPLQTTASSPNGGTAPVIDRSSLASIAAGVQPTVVDIKTGSGEGSGVVISSDGYIVTNNHVVQGATGSTVQVNFNSGKQIQAKIVGTDPKTDLAVVKADVTGLTAAQWGDSDAVRVGDTVLAIGSPLGLQGSVTAGIISALHRTITVGGEQQSQFDTGSTRTTIGDAIQTDAPINPGNSGGALVNTEGKVIGINSAIATGGSSSTGNIGLGFAISANKAKSVTDQIIKGGKVSHPYLGVSVEDAENGGALIQQVAAGSPAAKAGLKEGDVVTKVNDRTIAGSEELVGAVQASKVGSSMTLTVQRNGSESTVTATVGEAP